MLSRRLSEQQQVLDYLSNRVRQEISAAKSRTKYAGRCERLNENIAFCLYCTHSHDDHRFRRCLEHIVSLSPGVAAEALLQRIRNRFARTPEAERNEVSMGHGGGIGAREHRYAKKLWSKVCMITWVVGVNMDGYAPSGIEVFNKIAETGGEWLSPDQGVVGRRLSNKEKQKVKRVMKNLACRSGKMTPLPRLRRDVAIRKVCPLMSSER